MDTNYPSHIIKNCPEKKLLSAITDSVLITVEKTFFGHKDRNRRHPLKL